MKPAILVNHHCAPGDTLVLTACVRDIALTYPGRYQLIVNTAAMDLWAHNPHVQPLTKCNRIDDLELIPWRADYGPDLGRRASERIHFMAAFYRDLKRKLDIDVPIRLPYPDVHLGSSERSPYPGLPPRYWVIAAGGKTDFPVKIWSQVRFQAVIDALATSGIPCVQVGATGMFTKDVAHVQQELTGAVDLRGRTNLRELLRVMAHADGVICANSLPMHMAAALQKPAVVLAGGREAWWWAAYHRLNDGLGCPELLTINQTFLHTTGLLDCAVPAGCDQTHFAPAPHGRKLCRRPDQVGDQQVAQCLKMITPKHVIEAVMGYYERGELPPIQIDPEWGSVAMGPGVTRDHDGYDHPVIGGKLTLCGFLSSPSAWAHREFLSSLLPSLPADRVDVHLIAVDPVPGETLQTLQGLAGNKVKRVITIPRADAVTAQDRCWNDTGYRITTPYVVWMTDACRIADPTWLRQLVNRIVTQHPDGARFFGPRRAWPVTKSQLEQFRTMPWWHGRSLQDRMGRECPNGTWLHGAHANFFALATDTIRKASIPDVSAGDTPATLAAQVYQTGAQFVEFSGQRQFVDWDRAHRDN